MLKHNNIENEIKSIAAAQGKTLGEVAKEAGTSGSYVSRLLQKDPVNPTLESVLDVLGYDVKIEYVKKASAEGETHENS